MWRPPINFITLHYAWIIFCGLLGLVILYPGRNISAIDAYFFGASASTESGLNPIDVKALKLYQQLYVYFIPIITNLGFVNIAVVIVRLYWFRKKLGLRSSDAYHRPSSQDVESQPPLGDGAQSKAVSYPDTNTTIPNQVEIIPVNEIAEPRKEPIEANVGGSERVNISFSPDVRDPKAQSTLYIPSPRQRDNGEPFVEKEPDMLSDKDEDEIKDVADPNRSGLSRRRPYQAEDNTPSLGTSITHTVESMFVLGAMPTQDKQTTRRSVSRPRSTNLPSLSRGVTIGRNSQFHNLTPLDRDRLGGIEYRSLKLLLKIIIGYFFGLHALGVIFLLPWIHTAPAKYGEYLASQGVDKTWWAFYSSQTMISNLGLTLTPDSMISFKDATWPLLVMTFLAFAGNTCYPILLRLVIWTLAKIVPKGSRHHESLHFLLDHPRRCYTLLFPSKPTWILFGILFMLNFIDVLFIVVLDLQNPAVTDLPPGPRVLSALFQAASARHTGTATFNLADVNPAVQFSLVVMMYVAVLPIAISIRASNTYEEKTLGLYEDDADLDETDSKSYITSHIRNQLSFDLWYIFLGTFIICIAEAPRIKDEPSFGVFNIFFEVVSGYANVGLSLGYPTVNASLSGQFQVISKLVICAMMIRGRHRGLPYAIDKAITLPGEYHADESRSGRNAARRSRSMSARRTAV
ncbi:potassium transporter [Xylaria scruposa]|nr:potassium transporter [Xylaria scruposa]